MSVAHVNENGNSFANLQLKTIKKIAEATSATELESSLLSLLRQVDGEKVTYRKLSHFSKGDESGELYDGPAPIEATAVIGCGLSGLTAAKDLLGRGRRVILIDKTPFCGGNSSKASSGINGGWTEKQIELNIKDSADLLYEDTMKSSKRSEGSYTSRLARKMADLSKKAVEWIGENANVVMPDVGQLGGHSVARTHRPREGLSGAAFINGLEKAVMKYKRKGLLTVHQGSSLVGLEALRAMNSSGGFLDLAGAHEDDNEMKQSNNSVVIDGWLLQLQKADKQLQPTGEVSHLAVRNVILATGGFAADRSADGLLAEVEKDSGASPSLSTTNGPWATGDGIKLGRVVGAATVDMEMVQVHPTGFADNPAGFKDTGIRILCAEIMRGVGGVLLEQSGLRFTDELDTRKAITGRMNKLTSEGQNGRFVIALPPTAWEKVEAHVHIYTGKKLMHWVDGVDGVTNFVKKRLEGTGEHVRKTFTETTDGSSPVGRKTSVQLPLDGKYLVGVVQPVLHYTMGGLKIDPETSTVLDENGRLISGLYAAGELIGGVHGENRLGGSSLLDCVVFGLVSAEAADDRMEAFDSNVHLNVHSKVRSTKNEELDETSDENEVEEINIPSKEEGGLLVKIGDHHYDISNFVDLHPGGPILVEYGADLTERFTQAHGKDWGLLERDQVLGPVDSKGKAVSLPKKEKHHLADYGGKGGSWRELVGRHSWFLIHSIAAKYPEYPSKADKQAVIGFIAALGQLYPCKLCRKHLQQQLRNMEELGPIHEAAESRDKLVLWMCQLHNIVNKDIGKPLFECTNMNLDMMYLRNCGECSVERKDADGNKIDPSLLSGYHPHTGPWDLPLYVRDPKMLSSTTRTTNLWKNRQTAELIDILVDLKVISETEKSSMATKLQGPGGKALKKRLKNALKGVKAKLQETIKGEEE
eukprot:g6030.t1